jgi:hypothetical protein
MIIAVKSKTITLHQLFAPSQRGQIQTGTRFYRIIKLISQVYFLESDERSVSSA